MADSTPKPPEDIEGEKGPFNFLLKAQMNVPIVFGDMKLPLCFFLF